MGYMKLALPLGWAILDNKFEDEDPIIVDGELVNWHCFVEDLLWIQQVSMDPNDPRQLRYGDYSIDLGWYPDSDPEGSYRLVVLWKGWDNLLLDHRTRDRFEIQLWIERSLQALTEGIPHGQLVDYVFDKV